MKLSIARSMFFFHRRNFMTLLSTSNPKPPQISTAVPPLSSCNLFRLFSSGIPKHSESNLDRSRENDDPGIFSNEELKKLIEKVHEGDRDAFASVFETILKRKLSGKTDKLDDELLKDLPNSPPIHEDDGPYRDDDSSDSIFDSDEDK